MEHRPKPDRTFLVVRPGPLLPFLLEEIGDKSRNSVKHLLSRGQVLVDGQVATRHDHPLSPGQQVTCLARQGARAAPPLPVLYEDDRLLAVDKPAGLLTMASDGERLRTAYRMMTDYVRGADPGKRIFIVHRLDRDTSGVLLFAKDEGAKRALQDSWGELVRRRGYLAVVEGAPPKPEGVIRTLLRENAAHKVYSVPSGGKTAVTRYKTLRTNGNYSLLEVELETGRKNQIRAHLSELGCPVAGDKTYGAAANPLGRLCLHAHALDLDNPLTGGALALRSPAPKGFSKLAR